MDELPKSLSESESLHSFISGQVHLQVRVRQEGNTNFVSWNTSQYNVYPYVTLTRQDTSNDTGLVTLFDHWPKRLPPFLDVIDAFDNVGHIYAYTVILSSGVQIGAEETVSVVIDPPIKSRPVDLGPIDSESISVDPIAIDPISSLGEQSIEHTPVETIHELPLKDLPSVASEEHIQEE